MNLPQTGAATRAAVPAKLPLSSRPTHTTVARLPVYPASQPSRHPSLVPVLAAAATFGHQRRAAAAVPDRYASPSIDVSWSHESLHNTMAGQSRYIIGTDTLRKDRTVLNWSMYWSMIAQLCTTPPCFISLHSFPTDPISTALNYDGNRNVVRFLERERGVLARNPPGLVPVSEDSCALGVLD